MTTIQINTTTVPRKLRSQHRLGKDLTAATDIADAMDIAGLNWGLGLHEAENMTLMQSDGLISTRMPDMQLVIRDDNQVCLGAVGSRFTLVDNEAVFGGIGGSVMDLGGVPTVGGELDHGRKVFMRFDLPEAEVKIGDKDLVRFSILLKAAHDGSGHVVAETIGERLTCMNGMTATLKGLPHILKVRHTRSAHERMATAVKATQGAMAYAKGFAAAADAMLDARFTAGDFGAFIDRLFPQPDAESKRATTLWQTRRSELMALFNFAETQDFGRGSRWAAYNAVTEYQDWVAPVRGSNLVTPSSARARRQLENSAQDVKDEAWSLLAV